MKDYMDALNNAQKQILIFSGNLSFINAKTNGGEMLKTFDNLIKRNILVKVICRVDLAGRSNVEKLLALNFKYGKEMIEIRHSDQPLRGAIIDLKGLRLKEINPPTGKTNELNKEVTIIYVINDKEWIEWTSKIFWKIFSSSIDANKRLRN